MSVPAIGHSKTVKIPLALAPPVDHDSARFGVLGHYYPEKLRGSMNPRRHPLLRAAPPGAANPPDQREVLTNAC